MAQRKRGKKLAVPVFSSAQEEAEFWDTHDSMDYQWEAVPDVVVMPRKPALEVQLALETAAELEAESAKMGCEPAALAGILIVEGLASRKRRKQ